MLQMLFVSSRRSLRCSWDLNCQGICHKWGQLVSHFCDVLAQLGRFQDFYFRTEPDEVARRLIGAFDRDAYRYPTLSVHWPNSIGHRLSDW
jgi:hypothetical protein